MINEIPDPHTARDVNAGYAADSAAAADDRPDDDHIRSDDSGRPDDAVDDDVVNDAGRFDNVARSDEAGDTGQPANRDDEFEARLAARAPVARRVAGMVARHTRLSREQVEPIAAAVMRECLADESLPGRLAEDRCRRSPFSRIIGRMQPPPG